MVVSRQNADCRREINALDRVELKIRDNAFKFPDPGLICPIGENLTFHNMQ